MGLNEFLMVIRINSSDYMNVTLISMMFSIIFLFVLINIKIYLNHRKYSHIPGPSNKGILGFYLGQAISIIKNAKNGEIFAKDLNLHIEKYGRIIKFNFLHETIVHTVDPDAVKQILLTEPYEKHPLIYKIVGFPLGGRFLGNGLITDRNNETWRKKRSMFNPAFHRRELKSYMSEFNSTADMLIHRLRDMADGKTIVRLHDEVSRASMDMISNIAFGMTLEALNDPDNKISHCLRYILKEAHKTFLDPFFLLNPKNRSKVKEFRQKLADLRVFAKEQILKRMEEIKTEEVVRDDILTFILKSQENKVADFDDMIDEFVTFFFAGHETTASTIGFFFQEVGRHPEIFHKVKTEIENVIGSRSTIQFEDVPKLEYTSCVLKEVLRKYPPAATLSRYTNKETTICGYKIPKNTWIEVSPYSSHHYSKNFVDPFTFNPDRFSNELKNKNNINFYTYFPFSLGPRNCIGKNFAEIEMKVIISKIIQNFDVTIDQTQSFEIHEALTTKPKDGTRCTLTFKNDTL